MFQVFKQIIYFRFILIRKTFLYFDKQNKNSSATSAPSAVCE